jgi:hypothetical protein
VFVVLRHAAAPLMVVALAAGGRLTVDAGGHGAYIGKARPLKHLAEGPIDDSRKGTSAGEGPRTTTMRTTVFNVHSREVLPIPEGGVAAARLSDFLRCRATGQTREMSARPMEVALAMAELLDAPRVHVVSGFRSEKLNELLRKKGHGVAARSRHVRGEALDFRIPGVPAPALARAVAEMHEGGIGTYRESDFVHVDVGPNRRWRGR